MERSEKLVKRSFSMNLAAYYLSRCGERTTAAGQSKPPRALGVEAWGEAYDFFFDAMGEGRTPSQFRNSMKNVRDTFDTLFDNGRIGWIDKDGRRPSLSTRFLRIHEEWKDRQDQELESLVLGLRRIRVTSENSEEASTEARTEGGDYVFVSVRRERDPKLRSDALSLHGFDCMACGFSFEECYGDIGKGFIEVHHVVPLSKIGQSETNPETDLIVLCANCHRMIHRRPGICVSLEELKGHIKRLQVFGHVQ